MSFFSWLSSTPHSAKNGSSHGRRQGESATPNRVGGTDTSKSEDTKSHRHARREDLYTAIRESMTRLGVLSACFKFKVLSLDAQGDTFLVMIDLTHEASSPSAMLKAMEEQIMRHAMARFDIAVSAVYWRLDETVVPKHADFQETVESPQRADGLPHAAPVYRTIEVDELAAFKRARQAAALKDSASPAPAKVASSPLGKPSPAAPRPKNQRPPTGAADFADTQLSESPHAPGLSTTQYGDLN